MRPDIVIVTRPELRLLKYISIYYNMSNYYLYIGMLVYLFSPKHELFVARCLLYEKSPLNFLLGSVHKNAPKNVFVSRAVLYFGKYRWYRKTIQRKFTVFDWKHYIPRVWLESRIYVTVEQLQLPWYYTKLEADGWKMYVPHHLNEAFYLVDEDLRATTILLFILLQDVLRQLREKHCSLDAIKAELKDYFPDYGNNEWFRIRSKLAVYAKLVDLAPSMEQLIIDEAVMSILRKKFAENKAVLELLEK